MRKETLEPRIWDRLMSAVALSMGVSFLHSQRLRPSSLPLADSATSASDVL